MTTMTRKPTRIPAVDAASFSRRLQYLMHEHCVSVYGLAMELGTTPTTTRRWVDGTGLPDAHGIVMLCQFFCCSSDWLLGLRPEIPDPILPKGLS